MARGLSDVDRAAWDEIANPPGARYDPFISWDFLEALESSGAATIETGWAPHHLLIHGPGETLRAAMPLYAKTHSQGEFVFDHGWADAFERAGGSYYPKLLSAVPFTPVTGRRLLVPPGPDQSRLIQALVSGAVKIAEDNELSSLHINFLEANEAETLGSSGMMLRTDQQFHWINDDYTSFDDFLSVLSSAKRKNLRKERKRAQDGLEFVRLTGADITEDHWDSFFRFYIDTGSRKWGTPYLTRETFSLLGARMAEQILLIFAMDSGVPIAGAMSMIGSDTLYGRYWGCLDPRPFLHFETCYYQAIDYAIEHELNSVEAGAQGGHKLARGYGPVATYSAHWIAHPGLREAISEYLDHERQAVAENMEFLKARTPFRKDR